LAALCGLVLAGGMFWLCARSEAQSPPDSSVGSALRSLAARAGVVFVGQVRSVERKGGVVEVQFRVDQPVLGMGGTAAGGVYTLREWAGLWADQPRYRPGQRAMVFLYPPNAAGLSSPVDGMDGVVPLLPMGVAATPLLDARRLATRIGRRVGAPLAAAETGAVALPEAMAAVAAWRNDALEPALRPLPEGVRPRPFVPGGADAAR